MAGTKLKLDGRVPGSTIIEVIVSMVVVVLVFGIAMMIFNNVLRVSLSVKKIRAQAILQQTMITLEQTKELHTQSIVMDGITIEETIGPSQQAGLYQVRLVALDGNKEKVAELQKIIAQHD